MSRRYDFVSIPEPTKPGFGLTSADRQKVRRRAAKTDPFAVDTKRRAKRESVQTKFEDSLSGASGSSLHSDHGYSNFPDVDSSIAWDILQLQESAQDLNLFGTVSPELDGLQQSYDEGYFSRRLSWEDSTTLVQLPGMHLDQDVEATEGCSQPLLNVVPQLQGYMSAGRIDPFWTFPIRFQKCLPAIIQHEVHHLPPVIPRLDSGDDRTLLRWFALGVQEPAHLFATLAFAAAHLLDAGSTLATAEDVFFLKGNAISTVNEALQDPNRAVSSPIIGAVMCLAAFEFVFGDFNSYRAHMEGCKRLIKMRGGIRSLEPWISRFIKWIRGSSGVWKVYWPYSRQIDLCQTF